MRIFQPIARELTRSTGHTFVYRRADSWLAYQQNMRAGRYHLLFDDPHFVGWRLAKNRHVPLVKLPIPVSYATVAKRDGTIYDRADLIGNPVCAEAATGLGTLDLLSRYRNPLRKPQVVVTPNPQTGLHNLDKDLCDAVVVRVDAYRDFSQQDSTKKIVYQSDFFPGPAVTVEKRMPPGLRASIRKSLLSAKGRKATAALAERYGNGRTFVYADSGDYETLANLYTDYSVLD